MDQSAVTLETHKERILEAASNVFLESGFEQTSTADIAKRAKVSKRELYRHFSDKRAILAAVITQLQTDMQSRMNVKWSSTDDLVAVLNDAAATILDFILSKPFARLFRIVAAESYHDPEVAERFFQLGPHQGRKATAAYFKAQMKQGKLRVGDPLKAADDFLDLVVGAQLLTAVILGQVKTLPRKRAHVERSVEAFLTIYACENSAAKNSPKQLRRI